MVKVRTATANGTPERDHAVARRWARHPFRRAAWDPHLLDGLYSRSGTEIESAMAAEFGGLDLGGAACRLAIVQSAGDRAGHGRRAHRPTVSLSGNPAPLPSDNESGYNKRRGE